MGLIAWIAIGLTAGWLAGKVAGGGSHGLLSDLALGLVGAVVGGWLYGLFATPAELSGLVGSVIVAVIGAGVLIGLARISGARALGT